MYKIGMIIGFIEAIALGAGFGVYLAALKSARINKAMKRRKM